MSSEVTGATLTGGTITTRGISGYLIGASTGGVAPDSLDITTQLSATAVRVYVSNADEFPGATNNTPANTDVYGVTLKFT